jgi:microcystin degradation protein MlrC
MRLAFARIAQETNTLSPLSTTMDDFRATHFHRGSALMDRCVPGGAELPAFLADAELSGFVRRARREAELDGLYLSLHGAMGAHGHADPEADILERVRQVLGPDVPVVVSLDLHAQVTQRLIDAIDGLVAYHTNPHRDHADTGRRAGQLLLDIASGRARPTLAWRSLPMILGGGTTVDFLPTMRPLFRRLKKLSRSRGVLAASLLMCHPWNDHPDLGWSVVVITDDDPERAERLADELAMAAWGVREVEVPAFVGPVEALNTIRASKLRRRFGTACICDASDVVGAGAAGENTHLLRALLDHGQGLRSYLPLRDAQAVDQLWDATETVELAVGGRIDPQRNPAVTLRGRVRHRSHRPVLGRVVVLEAGDQALVLTEGPPLAMKPAFYSDVGLNPWKADVVVVKSFFPFRLYFVAHNRQTLYVRTHGVTDLDAAMGLSFNDPVHPAQQVDCWRPADRRRRGA